MATIKGRWKFNDEPTAISTRQFLDIAFNSYPLNEGYDAINISTSGYISYNRLHETGGHYYGITVYSPQNGWYDDDTKYKFIDFGDSEKEVPDIFYNWFTSNAKQVTNISYYDIPLEVPKSKTVTFNCIDKVMKDNIIISDIIDNDYKITYNGIETFVNEGQKATVKCKEKMMKSNLTITSLRNEEHEEVVTGPYLAFSSPSTFTINVVDNVKYWDGTLEYSTDASSWNV